MKRLSTLIGLSALVLLLLFVSKAFQPATLRAFTMTMVFDGPPSRTNPPVQSELRRLMAYRSDGSNVTKSIPLNGLPDFGDRSLTLRPQGQRVYILDALKLKSTTASAALKAEPPALDSVCSGGAKHGMTFVKTDVYAGYDTFVYTIKSTTPDGDQQTVTRWLAPALQCRDIQSTLVLTEPSGTVKNFHNYAVSIVEGEPDPALFAIPDGYTEVAPSEMESRRAAALGRPLQSGGMNMLQHRDEVYQKSRP
jgi:hypothetical protein